MRVMSMQEGKYPVLKLLHAIPNGGLRNKTVAAKMKAEGVKSGVPDLCLPVPVYRWDDDYGCFRVRYHGLYCEMKAEGGRTTKSQKRWLRWLESQGYYVTVCYGWEEARIKILQYIESNESEFNTTELLNHED